MIGSFLLVAYFSSLAIAVFHIGRKGKRNGLCRLISGHLPLLKQPKPIHRILHDISQKYGPVVTLKFGFRTVIIVSSPAAVEECFTKNDITLANRPPFLNGKVLNYNFTTLAAAPYGDHWRNLRRLTAIEVFSASRLNTFASIRREEVKNLLRKIHKICGDGSAVIELRTMLLDLNFNVMMRMVAGKKYYGEDVDGLEESKRFKDMMHEFSECTRVTNLGDLFPILQCIDYDGFKNRMTQLGKRMDAFWQGLIDEHRVDKSRNTMVSHLLALQESEPEYYTDEIIKGIILMMLVAGTKTSALSLEWAFSNLLNNPRALKKAVDEVDTQVGHGRLADEPDFANLHYIQCIIHENLRLCPPAPLLVPHVASERCTLGGYDIPSGAMVLVNAWSIHRNPDVWDDPLSFKPERFENGKGEPYRLLPFGLGRRGCPGEAMAFRVINLVMSQLLQCFEFSTVHGEEVDMTETAATLMLKITPLHLVCKARPNTHNLFA
ncbi:hypothetical protein POTOM_019403 [Populus tomentosa]|uniref:Uncharacterized protein n=1 Tax=Populus tomentosa TaxID=118781 RepID=A0A8X7ZU16_POPTO|nr:hypothetical protein POTOM_019403 [Populus tomentosa]